VDVLAGGRLELGLGAGHMEWEFDAVGIAWIPHREGVAAVRSALDELERLFTGPGYPERREGDEFYDRPVLRPVQRRGLSGSGLCDQDRHDGLMSLGGTSG
jgi:alkanesulfonate monooxygenase SsuD/methylene tetrahydromethanopterin reductase-like flavin-dependent oxidoreductase (luciferase family)